ncbi:MAG: CobW family GTP-binding protein [Acidimicrobiales bacterium]
MRYREPEFLPWDGRRVPMTFISGYLGAGKTTLINKLLMRCDRPIAVLVNDVGEVNIDARLIRRRSGDTIEMTDGCICCSLNDGFGSALDQIRAREVPPDHLVVELSGVSIPHRVLPWSGSAGFTLDGVITLVDADQLVERLTNPVVASTITAQVADADLVLLTKTDLADSKAVVTARDTVREMNPTVPVRHASTDHAAALLELGGRRPGGPTSLPPMQLLDAHEVATIAIPCESDPARLEAFLESLPQSVVRAKGVARAADGALVVLQKVGRRVSVTPLPQSEHGQPTDLVVIHCPE